MPGRRIPWPVSAAAVVASLSVSAAVVIGVSGARGADEPSPAADVAESWEAVEERSLRYLELGEDVSSAGVGIDGDDTVIVRVYAGEDLAVVESAFAREGLDARVLPSRYARSELESAEAALRELPLDGAEAFGFQYDAVRDVLVIGGTVSADALAGVLGAEFAYEFEPSESAGRLAAR